MAARASRDDEGVEPDPRFTLANERTFLAWNRTALALVATGVAAAALLPERAFREGRLLGVPLIVLGAVVTVVSYQRWQANQRAMRLGRPLPRSIVPTVLAAGIGIVAAMAAVVVLVGPR